MKRSDFFVVVGLRIGLKRALDHYTPSNGGIEAFGRRSRPHEAKRSRCGGGWVALGATKG